MKYIYILEDDSKFRNEMIEAIRKIDPQLAVRFFSSLDEFAKWIRLAMSEGPDALPKGGTAPEGQIESTSGTHQLLLVISKNEFLGAKHLSLLHKTRDLFIKKNLCTKEDPTSLVITCFDSPDFDIKLVEDRIINNVILKPFDKLILQQHLTFAIGGRHPASQYSVHNMKTSTTIEMLKELEIEAVSDIGFISISYRPITVGSVAKYYSPIFESYQHRSMIALCLRCDPHPEKPTAFRCAFSFVAADPYQITNIRKLTRNKELPAFPYEWTAEPGGAVSIHVAVITKDEHLGQNFVFNLEDAFINAKIHRFQSMSEFLYTIDPELAKKDKKEIPHQIFHAIFAEQDLFEEGFVERWKYIVETQAKHGKAAMMDPPGKPAIFVLSSKSYTDKEEKALAEVAVDVFHVPVDILYILKKIRLFVPQLNPREKSTIASVAHPHIGKAASPIEISEFSEAGLVMKYYRPISTGSFREFVLWLPQENEVPELLATSNYSEENKSEKGVFYNHFVFFGMSDHYLKHIRRWILYNHVQSKESESA